MDALNGRTYDGRDLRITIDPGRPSGGRDRDYGGGRGGGYGGDRRDDRRYVQVILIILNLRYSQEKS